MFIDHNNAGLLNISIFIKRLRKGAKGCTGLFSHNMNIQTSIHYSFGGRGYGL